MPLSPRRNSVEGDIRIEYRKEVINTWQTPA